MGVDRAIDITAAQRKIILALLRKHLPNTAAWVYGSRATWNARPQSDLDMVVFTTPAQERGVSYLRDAFEESALPFRVDLFVWDAVPKSFHKQIEAEHVVLVEKEERSGAGEQLFGPLPEDWEYTTLGIACHCGGGDIQTGPFGSQLHASDYVSTGIPSIMPQNIGDNRIIEDGIARISPTDARRLSRYLVRKGDIVYSRRGDVERRALIRELEDGWLCGTGCLRVRLGDNGVDPRYASYFLGHPRVREWIVRHAHGATMPNLNTSILSSCPFVIPPKKEQRAIAHILGTLDDKIELNRRMNETLEEMARTLFKSWFVDFDPVHAKATLKQHSAHITPSANAPDFPSSEGWPEGPGWVSERAAGATHPAANAAPLPGGDDARPPHGPSPLPNGRVLSPPERSDWTVERARAYLDGMDADIATLFPDSFVDSELGPIPAGWATATLYDHFEAVKGVSYKGSGLGDNGVPLHNLNSIHEGGSYKYEGIKYYSGEYADRHVVRPGDVIVANTEQGHNRLLIGYTAIVPRFFGNHGIVSHHIYRLRPKRDSQLSATFLCFLLNSPRMHDLVSGYANGTTVNMLPLDAVQKPLIVLPPKTLVETFDVLALSCEYRREETVQEARTLSALRDTLLPKLISGEVRVKDVEKASEQRR